MLILRRVLVNTIKLAVTGLPKKMGKTNKDVSQLHIEWSPHLIIWLGSSAPVLQRNTQCTEEKERITRGE